MQETSDTELLRQYLDERREGAFAALVNRHIGLVYSAALRKTGNPQAAEEVVQAVFILLAKKARSLRQRAVLSGWLYQAARFAAASFLRTEIRRAHREQEAFMQSLSHETEPDIWPQIVPLLEDAMGKLGEKERDAIILRFFEGKSFQEIAEAVGASENAAKKRVGHGLEKLRKRLAQHGVSSTATALAEIIAANSIQFPPELLAKSVTALAMAKGPIAAASTLALVKGTLKMMTWTKMKFALGIASVILLAGGAITIALSDASDKSATTVSNERQARIERSEFSAGVVRYAYPPGNPQPTVIVFSPRLAGLPSQQPVLSAEFSWKSDAAIPLIGAMRVVPADEQSNEFDPGVNDAGAIEQSGDRQYWATDVPVFPRRGKTIHLRLIANDKQTLADLAIPNPARGSYPVWRAQPLPATAETNGLEVTLEKFRSLQTVTNEDRTPRTECYFQFRENGRETFDWMPVLIQISDATSNHWIASRWDKNPYLSRVEDGLMRSEFLGALWPGESAWKLHADFKRTANFPEHDLLQVSHIRIPAADELAQPHTHYDFNGASIDLSAVIGKDVAWDRIVRLNPERKQNCITVQLSGQILSRNRQLTFIEATDDKGRAVKLEAFRDPAIASNESNVPYSFVFHPLNDASELNLTVAVSETRTVEFIAKPEQVNEKN